jgi:hypothetical protein
MFLLRSTSLIPIEITFFAGWLIISK